MATKLDKAIRRELEIGGTTYMITLAPEGLKVVPKGKRKGVELDWERILRGDVRPEDYLPVTPEVESRVARDFAFATEHVRKRVEAGRLPAGSAFEPNARFDGVGLTAAARQRNQWLLSLHHGGQNIAYIEDENGVIVLAVGLEEGGALIDAFPYELRKGVGFGAPPLPDVVEIY